MSHVAMEKKMCEICGVIHEHNTSILLDTHLNDIDPDKTVTGFGLCEEHDKLHKDGYLALIVVKTPPEGTTMLTMDNAERTGECIHIKREVVSDTFKSDISVPMAFIDEASAQKIKDMAVEEIH
jgi:hypothetical protein